MEIKTLEKTLAFKIGVSDFFFNNTKKDNRRKAPIWMNKKEAKEWDAGFKHAKQLTN